jgi:hypothetical protein
MEGNQMRVQIRLADETGKILRWNISRVPHAINFFIGGSKIVSGWEFSDHDGYVRFAEGNWRNVVPLIRSVAENYNLILISDLS